MRVDNTGDQPIRIAADPRLLSFEVDTHTKGKRPLSCAVPRALRPSGFPEKRALLLAPGKSYVESFDPRLFCFGKLADALRGSVIVRTRFGWDPPPKWSRKAPSAPFVAEGTTYPPTIAPLRELTAPTIILSYAHAPDDDEHGESPRPKLERNGRGGSDGDRSERLHSDRHEHEHDSNGGPATSSTTDIVDENAAKLGLTTAPYADAHAARDVRVAATVTNTGHRPATVALRPRMLGFHVVGPDGATQDCRPTPPSQTMPRDMFRELGPGGTVSLSVLVVEQCPELHFNRPGLYHVTASLSAEESGERFGLDTWTGTAAAPDETLVRVASGPEAFDASTPVAVPTPTDDVATPE